jgi:hypothetical protein
MIKSNNNILFLELLQTLQDKQDKIIFEGNFFMSFRESKDRNGRNNSQWDNIPLILQTWGQMMTSL